MSNTTIQRGYSLPQDQFTIVPNAWIRDPRLTHKARGLLVELMSHRPGWSTSVEQLAKIGPDGESAIKSALKELETSGYLIREWVRDSGGRRAGTSYTIVDPAAAPSGENHLMDENLQVNPLVENRPMENLQVAPSGDFPPVDGQLVEKPPVGKPGHKKNTSKKTILEEEKGGPGRAVRSRKAAPATPPSSDSTGVVMGGVSAARRRARGRVEDPVEGPVLSRFCARHPEGTERPCRACGSAREAFDAAEAARAAEVKADRAAARVSARDAKIRAIKACDCCDDRGYRLDDPKATCNHVPDQRDVNRRGMANARAELARKKAS